MSLKIIPNPAANAFALPDGDLELLVPAWSGLLLDPAAPFERATHDQPVTFALQTPATAPATFEAAGRVQLTLGGTFAAQLLLDLIWSADSAAPALKPLVDDGWLPAAALDNGELHLACLVTAQTQLHGTGGAPLAGIGHVALGLTAGGEVELLRVKRYPRTDPAQQILLDFFSTFRSPLRAPVAGATGGEVVSFAYQGGLQLTASLSAGYDVAGFAGFTVGSLKPQLHYRLAAKASAEIGFNLGGAFRYTLGPGSAPDWVRVRLTKEDAAGGRFGFGLTVGGELKVDGLPENTDRLFDALLGLDVGAALGWVETVASFDSFEAAKAALTERFGDYAAEQLGALAAPVFAKAFSSEAYAGFRAAAQKVAATTADLRARAVQLLERYEGDRQKAVARLKAVAALTPASLRTLSDNDVWEFLLDAFGETVLPALASNEAVATASATAEKLAALLESDLGEQLAKLWTELGQRTRLTQLAGALATAADPVAARAVIDPRLETLARHAFGLAVDRLVPTAAGEAVLRTAQNAARGVLRARDALDEALHAAREQKFAASVGLELGRTRERSALLELEFNLATAQSELDAALAGDFSPALTAKDVSRIRLRGGRLRQVSAATRTVNVAAFGWSHGIVSKLEQISDAAIQPAGEGTVFLITTDTALERESVTRTRQQIEEVKTRFVLRSLATSTGDDRRDHAFLRPLLEGLTVSYAVAQSDTDTSWEELDEYLRFADDLDLIPGPPAQRRAVFLASLRNEFPDTPGKVGLDYAVKYPSDALLRALRTLGDDARRDTARTAIRRYFAARYRTRQRNGTARAVIETYMKALRVNKAPSAGGVHHHGTGPKADVTLADGTARRVSAGAAALLSWWREETRFLEALDDLATAVKQPVDSESLDRLTQRFVGVAEGEPLFGSALWTENVFFLAVDALLSHPQVNVPRQALLTLRLQPPGAAKPILRLLPSASVAPV
ncbi:MAG TPA: hypothetical protein VGD81_19685 [Opitutaceae bacterium]